MRSERDRRILVASLLLLVVLSLCLVALVPFDEAATADDIYSCLETLGGEPGDALVMRERAYVLGETLFENAADCDRFADELAGLYLATKDVDFLLVYNTGGFGGGVMADDPEWPSVLEGMTAELAVLGYTSAVTEHQRSEGGLLSMLDQVEEIQQDYRTEAPVLAAKAAFLTWYNPGLTVIVTGRCFGSVISNEVMEIDAENTQLYSIQAGRPFWYTDEGGERSLVIEDNGVMTDILSSRGWLAFLWALAKANLGGLPSTAPPEEGSFKAINWYLKAPGHTYTWDHPGVRSSIIAFLEEHFAPGG